MKLVEQDFESERRRARLAKFQSQAPSLRLELHQEPTEPPLGEWIGQAQDQVAQIMDKTEREIRGEK